MRLTMIMPAQAARSAASITRCVTISMPAAALMTTRRCRRPAARRARVRGDRDSPGVSINVTCLPCDRGCRAPLRAVLQLLLLRIEVAHGRPALERAHGRYRARRVQHRFRQEGLARSGVTDERERMDVFERVLRHGPFLEDLGLAIIAQTGAPTIPRREPMSGHNCRSRARPCTGRRQDMRTDRLQPCERSSRRLMTAELARAR